MKKILTSVAIIALCSSCGNTKKMDNSGETAPLQVETAAESAKPLIEDVDGYFVTFKPDKNDVLLQDKSDFESNFNPATTMGSRPTTVDFSTYQVGAIVAAVTAYATDIVINKTSIENRKLIVDYSINSEGEKRTYTIAPVKLFQFNKSDVDSVSFVSSGDVKTLSVKK